MPAGLGLATGFEPSQVSGRVHPRATSSGAAALSKCHLIPNREEAEKGPKKNKKQASFGTPSESSAGVEASLRII